jgi:hypothetical protein
MWRFHVGDGEMSNLVAAAFSKFHMPVFKLLH